MEDSLYSRCDCGSSALPDNHPVFGTYAPIYAEMRLATVPLRDKAPLVRNPQRAGVRASLEFATKPKFMDASIGTWCGKRSGLTVVDIDEVGAEPLARALERFGPTPLIVRTHSGKHHAYYRNNGERRILRYRKTPLDILGTGLVVLPPSRTENGTYEFIRGGFDVLRAREDLPAISTSALGGAVAADQYDSAPSELGSDEGIRDNMLFAFCRKEAVSAKSVEELEALALARNSLFNPPLSDAQATLKAQTAWGYKEQGRLLLPGCEATNFFAKSEIETLAEHPFALALLSRLRLSHQAEPGKLFAAATAALAKYFRVRPKTITRELNRLIALGYLTRRHIGGKRPHDPSLYSLVRRVGASHASPSGIQYN